MLIERDFNEFWKIRWLDEFMLHHKGFIAGGCFKNIFQGEKVKDIDIFFENETDFHSAVEYFDGECKKGKDGFYRFYYENKKVKAYKHVGAGVAVELVCHAFGTAEQILNMFDFTVTKFAYLKREVEDDIPFEGAEKTHIEYAILHDDKYFEHLQLKRLVIDNQVLYPASTLDRMFKYARYGYFPCRYTKIKIIEALRNAEFIDGISESLYDGID